MGDIVLTSPVIRCLRKRYPNAEIHYLTKPNFASIVESNPCVTKVWQWNQDFKETLKHLKALKFDHVIDLHHNLRTKRVKLALGRPSSSFNKLNIEKYLMVRFRINRLPKKHIVERYLNTVAQLGVEDDGLGLDFFIASADEFDTKKLPANLQNGYVALVVGALKETKRMPEHLLRKMLEMNDLPFVVLGGKAEADLGISLSKGLENRVLNLCGSLSLGGSASVIQQASLVISHDTGLMHIAAAFQKPIITLWGNTIPEFGMWPYNPSNKFEEIRAEVSNLSCRPCSKIGYEKCPKAHFKCMENQDLKAISENAVRLFNQDY